MKTVIIIEDNLIPSISLEAMLQDKGYQVVGKLDSDVGAIELVKKEDPSIIILDIRLGGKKNGLEIAAEIREFSETPILFVSALTDVDTLKKIKTIDNSDLVAKPFSDKEFYSALELMS